jgi:hypothetical protein
MATNNQRAREPINPKAINPKAIGLPSSWSFRATHLSALSIDPRPILVKRYRIWINRLAKSSFAGENGMMPMHEHPLIHILSLAHSLEPVRLTLNAFMHQKGLKLPEGHKLFSQCVQQINQMNLSIQECTHGLGESIKKEVAAWKSQEAREAKKELKEKTRTMGEGLVGLKDPFGDDEEVNKDETEDEETETETEDDHGGDENDENDEDDDERTEDDVEVDWPKGDEKR